MAQHGQYRPQRPYPDDPDILPAPGLTSAEIQRWAHHNPGTYACLLERLLGCRGSTSKCPFGAPQIQRRVPTGSFDFYGRLARSFTTHPRGHLANLQAIRSNSLRMFTSSLVRFSIVPDTRVSLGQSLQENRTRSSNSSVTPTQSALLRPLVAIQLDTERSA